MAEGRLSVSWPPGLEVRSAAALFEHSGVAPRTPLRFAPLIVKDSRRVVALVGYVTRRALDLREKTAWTEEWITNRLELPNIRSARAEAGYTRWNGSARRLPTANGGTVAGNGPMCGTYDRKRQGRQGNRRLCPAEAGCRHRQVRGAKQC